MSDVGRLLIVGGVLLIVTGLIITALGKVPGAGKLPGDIFIKKENFSFYFPITTSLIVSAVLNLILYLWARK